ncbi:hypothetical protein [Streptomyces sp. NPDC056361]
MAEEDGRFLRAAQEFVTDAGKTLRVAARRHGVVVAFQPEPAGQPHAELP